MKTVKENIEAMLEVKSYDKQQFLDACKRMYSPGTQHSVLYDQIYAAVNGMEVDPSISVISTIARLLDCTMDELYDVKEKALEISVQFVTYSMSIDMDSLDEIRNTATTLIKDNFEVAGEIGVYVRPTAMTVEEVPV